MSMPDRTRTDSIPLYLSAEHPCSYLPGRSARTLFVDPLLPVSGALYQQLIDLGFRRSGTHLYRPACCGCSDCVSLRVPASDFRPRRAQSRCWKALAEQVTVTTRDPTRNDAHFELYARYTAARHPLGGMAEATPESYLDFLASSWSPTRLLEFRYRERPMAVAATDFLPQGLSAVYTFFDPTLASLSPGVFAVLWQIREARRLGLRWLYLGYWIRDCQKMSYKDQYRPVEAWTGSAWRRFEPGERILIP